MWWCKPPTAQLPTVPCVPQRAVRALAKLAPWESHAREPKARELSHTPCHSPGGNGLRTGIAASNSGWPPWESRGG
jgi:hypothetical protein